MRSAWGVSDHVFRNRGLGDAEAQLEQFPVNPWSAPKRVLAGHAADQRIHLCRDHRSTAPARRRFPAPIETKAFPMPSHHDIQFDDDHRIEAAGPDAVEQSPKGPIQRRQTKPAAVLAVQGFELMAQSHDFELQGSPVPEAGEQAMGEGAEKSDHAHDITDLDPKTRGFLRRTEYSEGTRCAKCWDTGPKQISLQHPKQNINITAITFGR